MHMCACACTHVHAHAHTTLRVCSQGKALILWLFACVHAYAHTTLCVCSQVRTYMALILWLSVCVHAYAHTTYKYSKHTCACWQVKTYVALILWLGLFHVNVLALALIVGFWPRPWAVGGLVLFMTLLLWPVHPDSAFGKQVARFVATNGPKYFPIKVSTPALSRVLEYCLRSEYFSIKVSAPALSRI